MVRMTGRILIIPGALCQRDLLFPCTAVLGKEHLLSAGLFQVMDTLRCLDVGKGEKSCLSCRQNVSLLPGNCSLACLQPSLCPSPSLYSWRSPHWGQHFLLIKGTLEALAICSWEKEVSSPSPSIPCLAASLCVHGRRGGLGEG